MMPQLPEEIRKTHPKWAWSYRDSQGNPRLFICRYDTRSGKRFLPYHLSEYNKWVEGAGNAPYPLYALDLIAKHGPSLPCFIAEGEKCAESLRHLELIATTSPFGAQSVNRTDWTPLTSCKELIILPDNDSPGQKYAAAVADTLHSLNPQATLWTCKLPGLEEGQDVVDWLKNQEELAGWDGFSPIDPDIGRFLKVRLLRTISEHKQKWEKKKELQPLFPHPPKKMVDLVGTPPFPSNAFPPELWRWCQKKAERMRIAPDFCCATLLVVLATLIGRKRQIRPEKNNPDWVVTPNLWGFIVGRSGVLKTPAMMQVFKGLEPLIETAMAIYREEYSNYEALKLQAQNSKNVELPPMPLLKRYKTDDPTIEALGPILRDNPQGILLFRDELPGWIKSMSKKGHENDRAFYLEAWNAASNFTTDRVGRGTIHIPSLCLSVFGGIQPGPLSTFIQQMHVGQDWDDGFFQRFQIIVWPKETEWRPFGEEADESLDDIIQELYGFLDKMSFDHEGKPVVLSFSQEAQLLFNEWQAELQPRIRSHDLPEHMASHLSKYPKLLPSIALILECAQAALRGREPTEVSTESFIMAKRWCQYLEPHAWRVYNCSRDELKNNTLKLIQKVRSKALPNGFTLREVYHGTHWAGLSSAAEVQTVCDFAESLNWLVKVDPPLGKRSSPKYYVHPDLLQEEPG
jgi:hypothetical protein